MSNNTSKHSSLYDYINGTVQRIAVKGALCVELLLMAVGTLTTVTQTHNGIALSKKQGGKKGSQEMITANVVATGLTNAVEGHFLDVLSEAKDLFPSLEYDETKGKANLHVVEITDLGEGKYSIDAGSQLRRLRAAFMTLCGDWRPLYENSDHPDVREFKNAYGETKDGINIGFSVAWAIKQLQRDDASQLLESVASAKGDVSKAIAKGSDTAEDTSTTTEGGNDDGGDDGGESATVYAPHVESLLKTVRELKLAIANAAPNMTVNEAQGWQDRLVAITTEMLVEGGEVAPIIADSTEVVNEPQKKAKSK